MGMRRYPADVLARRKPGVRTALAVLIAAVAALVLAAPARATTAPPLTCEQLVGAERYAEIEARGWVQAVGNTTPLFTLEGGVQCWWFSADSPRIDHMGVGYAPATDAQRAEERRIVLASGGFEADGDVLRGTGAQTAALADFVEASWLYADIPGFAFFATDTDADALRTVGDRTATDAQMDALMATMKANVVAAFAPAAPEEPVDEPSGPAVADPAFAATTPSTLSGLQTLGDVSLTPLGVGGCLAAALVLAALVGLPGRLVDSALSSRFDEWAGVLEPFVKGAGRIRAALERLPAVVVIGAGLVIASVFAALIDPGFGVNGGSLRLVLSLLAGMLAENLVGLALIAWWLRRRRQGALLRLRAGSLLIVLVTALLSRAVGFEPGFVFGFVLALVLATPTEEREAEASIAEGAWLLVLGACGWVAYSVVVAAGWADGGVAGLFAVETLAGVTVACLSALALVMMPLPGMAGRALWRRSRRLWAGAQAVAFAAFVFVVLPFPESWANVDVPFVGWVVAFVAYAAIAVGVWAVITFTPARWLSRDHEDARADAA